MDYIRLTALAVLAMSPIPAMADEVWETPHGTIIYEQDLGLMAVLSFPYATIAPGSIPEFAVDRGTLYFPGLAGNFDDRSIHDGYWIVQGGPTCSASISTADGQTSQRWGRARVIFDRESFPTSMTILAGQCFEEPTIVIRGERP